jgi:hypothetical protein
MINFDDWRKDYDHLTSEQQQEIYNQLEVDFPEQAHFDLEGFTMAFNLSKPDHVIEAGGWKGDLALMFVDKVKTWTNIDICQNAIEKTKCHALNFVNINPGDFDWFKNKNFFDGFDLFTSTHFIEHISDEHFDLLCQAIADVPYIYIESPLTDTGETWEGYIGTHKLSYGWNKITEKLTGHDLLMKKGFCRLYKRK